MKNIKIISLHDFYKNIAEQRETDINSLLSPDINKEIGHFNVFDLAETVENWKYKAVMPYNKRAFYKISLIRGKSTAEYADKVIKVETNALLFGTPRLPYRWIPEEPQLTGIYFLSAFIQLQPILKSGNNFFLWICSRFGIIA